MKRQLSTNPILLILAIVVILSSCTKELNGEKTLSANDKQSKTSMSSPHSDTLKLSGGSSILGFLSGSASAIGYGAASSDRTFYPSTELMTGIWTVSGSPFLFYGYFCTTRALGTNPDDIQTAYLQLYSNPTPINGDGVHANYGTNNAFYVQRVIGSWDVTQMNLIRWGALPGATTSDQVLVPHTSLASLDVTVDVTAMVKAAIRAGRTVIGFRLLPVSQSGLNMRNFVSCYHERTDLQPRLIINGF
ncbi:MAG TPA: hypothetical protein VGE90_17890 [Chitinophaga sp.]